jgi:cobalt/nickel transport system permease protein
LTVSALFAGFEFGIQPLVFHTAGGVPLYAPYPLSVSIPAMVIPHALIGSVVEGLITAMVVAYLLRANPSALATVNTARINIEPGGFMKRRAAWIGLLALVILVPSGLLAPGTAWGEWGTAELSRLGLGYIPAGLSRLSGLWSSPLAAYKIPALGNASLAYILSALLGIVIIVVLTWLFSLLITRHGSDAD